MTAQTLGPRDGNAIRSSFGGYSLDEIVIVSGAGVVEPNTVLGKITASGKYQASDANATDGSEDPVGVLFNGVDATSADANAVMVSRMAELETDLLVWDSGNDSTDITNGLAALKALGLIPR